VFTGQPADSAESSLLTDSTESQQFVAATKRCFSNLVNVLISSDAFASAAELVWPQGMPEGRPIQQETIGEILDIIAETAERTQSCGGICIAVVQPPGTGTTVLSLFNIDMPLYLIISITGKTRYYRAVHCCFKCVVLVLIPLVP
jgi:hypothetical protein